MSDISKGDLCVVVKPKPCCGDTNGIGAIITAESAPRMFRIHCRDCKERYYGVAVIVGEIMAFGKLQPLLIDVPRLRRIPPLGELDAVKRNSGVLA